MANLLQTLYWSGDPTFSLDDLEGTGASESRAITAAESHDANDATYEGLAVPSDGVNDGHAVLTAHRAVGTASASGNIEFVRIVIRGRVTGGGGESATIYPLISGTSSGNVGLTSTYTDYSFDQATDPSDGLAWTNAKINGKTFGVTLEGFYSAGAGAATVRVPEFRVEVWGTVGQTSTPSSVSATAAVGVAAAIAGLAVLGPASVGCVGAVSAPTVVPGGVVATAVAVSVEAEVVVQPTKLTKVSGDPTLSAPQASYQDAGQEPATSRSFKSSLNDQSTLTKDSFAAAWPTAGATQLQPLYGAGAQGLQGSTSINGSGLISGVKLFAIVRCGKSGAGALSGIRFGTGMGLKTLVTQPTIRTLPLDDTMWETVETDLITLGSFGQPFEWGNGVNSVWAQMFGWTFNHTYALPSNPSATQVDVAEAWVEIHSPVTNVEEVVLRVKLDPTRVSLTMTNL